MNSSSTRPPQPNSGWSARPRTVLPIRRRGARARCKDGVGSSTNHLGECMTDKDFMVKHRLMDLTGMRIFYREAGSPGSPAVLLLHGFPSSSHQFRFLIPAIADRFHVFAPDFPAFGFSSCPALSEYEYTFEHHTDTIEHSRKRWGLTGMRYMFTTMALKLDSDWPAAHRTRFAR